MEKDFLKKRAILTVVFHGEVDNDADAESTADASQTGEEDEEDDRSNCIPKTRQFQFSTISAPLYYLQTLYLVKSCFNAQIQHVVFENFASSCRF